ncbi:hypothetical protein ACVW0Y_004596 [Pseudomonas sp. TE3786]
MTSRYSTRRAVALPLSQSRSVAKAKVILAIGQSQVALAKALQVSPPAISRMERHTDIYIATLRSQIESMGGQLQMIVRFPEGSVKLSNFIDLDNESQQADDPSFSLG